MRELSDVTDAWWRWAWVPGFNWVAWLYVAIGERRPGFVLVAALYASPWLLLVGRVRSRPVLIAALASWAAGLAHSWVVRARLEASRALPSAGAEEQRVLRAAHRRGGELTLAQAIEETGLPSATTRSLLEGLVDMGVAEVDVTEGGAYCYRFPGLAETIRAEGQKATLWGHLAVGTVIGALTALAALYVANHCSG